MKQLRPLKGAPNAGEVVGEYHQKGRCDCMAKIEEGAPEGRCG